MNRELKIMSDRVEDYLAGNPDKDDDRYYCKRGDIIIRFQRDGTPYTSLQLIEVDDKMTILNLELGYTYTGGRKIVSKTPGQVTINEFIYLAKRQNDEIGCFVVYGRLALGHNPTNTKRNKQEARIVIVPNDEYNDYISSNY